MGLTHLQNNNVLLLERFPREEISHILPFDVQLVDSFVIVHIPASLDGSDHGTFIEKLKRWSACNVNASHNIHVIER